MKVGILVEKNRIGYFSKKYLELFAVSGHEVEFIHVSSMKNGNKKHILCKDSLFEKSQNKDIIFSMIGLDLLKEALGTIYYQFSSERYPLFITNANDIEFYQDRTFIPEELVDKKIQRMINDLDNEFNTFNEEIKVARAFYNVTPDLLDNRDKINSNVGIIALSNRVCGDLDLFRPFFDSLKKEDIEVLNIHDQITLNKVIPWIIQQSVLSKAMSL